MFVNEFPIRNGGFDICRNSLNNIVIHVAFFFFLPLNVIAYAPVLRNKIKEVN